MALTSAWAVLIQCPSIISWPTSSQWANPRGAPLYPVDKIALFFAITAPTLARSQVERFETTLAISRKYSSQDGLLDFSIFFNLVTINLGYQFFYQQKRPSSVQARHEFPFQSEVGGAGKVFTFTSWLF